MVSVKPLFHPSPLLAFRAPTRVSPFRFLECAALSLTSGIPRALFLLTVALCALQLANCRSPLRPHLRHHFPPGSLLWLLPKLGKVFLLRISGSPHSVPAAQVTCLLLTSMSVVCLCHYTVISLRVVTSSTLHLQLLAELNSPEASKCLQCEGE